MMNWIFILLLIIILCCVIVIIAAHFENRRFRVTEYTVSSDKVKKPFTVAVLADLHNYEYGPSNDRLMNALKEIMPTLVISAGDMVEAGKYVTKTKRTVEFLERVSGEFDFIYGLGNHELKLLHDKGEYQTASSDFKAAVESWQSRGYTDILDNKVITRDNLGISVYGLNLEYDYFRKFSVRSVTSEHISELVGDPSPDTYNILIGHNPDQFESYADWGADLVLSGHVHGGMVCLPGGRAIIHPRMALFPKYYAGVYNKDKTDMVVSRGLGNHSVHLRIFNRAEIVVLRICPQE